MLMTLDVGNSQIYSGVYQNDSLVLQFRKTSKTGGASDELGIFLKSVLRENGIDPTQIKRIAACTVVPELLHSLRGACKKYFSIEPFILDAHTKTGLKILCRTPDELGSDRIANAIGALHLYPGKNLIIADYGTATTFCLITAEREYLGGLIMPGLKISMEALETKTAKLPTVEIIVPKELVGRDTAENIQNGLYFSNLYALKGISDQIRSEYFKGKNTVLIGTGGFSRLFEKEKIFDVLVPDLVLLGLKFAYSMNC